MKFFFNSDPKETTSKREISEEEFKAAVSDETYMEKYTDNYSENNFWDKVRDTVKHAGLGLIYKALQLYYVTENPNCPTKVKVGIYAALGYFITPLDIIADFVPFVGYTDDTSAIAVAIAMAHMYIDETIKQKAKDKIRSIFGDSAVSEFD